MPKGIVAALVCWALAGYLGAGCASLACCMAWWLGGLRLDALRIHYT